ISHKYLKNFANHAAALTGPSMKVQEFLTECGVKKSVNVVPNPVELDIFNPSNIDKEKANEIRKKYNIADNDILISFCGRLGKEKNVDMLIDFFVNEFTPEDGFKLLILGEGPCLEDFKLHAKKRNADDMIFFTGKIEHHDLPNYYGACQLYITASLSDTNSISMKEAMATGLPVIHIKDPLNKGQVEDGVNGFIYENQQQMRDILVNYKNMTDTQKEELKNSVINSVKIYGCEAVAEYLVGVYKSAIAGKYEEKSN
ncbi:MAG: glycosyltransferase, partial [Oscillospiraceae bacterium]